MATVRHIILGAGGGGRTVASVCRRFPGELGFLDDHAAAREVNGVPVLGTVEARASFPDALYIVAFGTLHREARRDVFRRLRDEGMRFFNAIAPEAAVDATVALGTGIFIGPQCAVMPNAAIGDNCFLCAAGTVDHDVVLGEGVYLSPGVNLAGGVFVGEYAFIGTNAAVVPGVRIGAWATVGAGAVVLGDVEPGAVVAGVPARTLKQKRSEP